MWRDKVFAAFVGVAVAGGALATGQTGQQSSQQTGQQQPDPQSGQAVDKAQSQDRLQLKVEVAKDKPTSLPDFRTGAKNPDSTAVAPYDKLSEYGTLPSSAFQDGGTFLPVGQRASEVFQYLQPGQQIHQSQLVGAQLAPVLLEFRFVNNLVKAGDELHAIARLSSVNKPRNFTGLFFHAEYGRSKPAVYVNFEPSKQDPTLFLGRAVLPKWAMGGHYVIQDCVIGDESGHRKAYMGDFFPVLQDPDGSPIGFTVEENKDADFEPPSLKRVALLTKHAKVGENIDFDIWAEDKGPSGLSEAQSYWVSPSGDQSLRADMVLVADGTPGHFRSSFQIPQFYEGGKWKLLSVKISDKATNEAFLFPPSVPMLRDVTVDVEQDPANVDREPPRLLGLQLSHDQVDRDKAVDITALVEDDKSGVKEVYVSFYSPYGVDFNRVKLSNEPVELNRRSAGKQVNVWRGSLRIKPLQEPGRWTVSRVNISDNANNYRNYNAVRDAIIKDVTVVFLDPRMKAKTTDEQ